MIRLVLIRSVLFLLKFKPRVMLGNKFIWRKVRRDDFKASLRFTDSFC